MKFEAEINEEWTREILLGLLVNDHTAYWAESISFPMAYEGQFDAFYRDFVVGEAELIVKLRKDCGGKQLLMYRRNLEQGCGAFFENSPAAFGKFIEDRRPSSSYYDALLQCALFGNLEFDG